MCKSQGMPPSERDEIIAVVTRLQEQVAELTAANEELRRQLAESQRNGRRQAAPFSKGKRNSKPRRPGRKPGMGLFSYRKPIPNLPTLTTSSVRQESALLVTSESGRHQ